eukprot:TRINITY_DN1899_c0_g1_i1.p1 TRINITY_DN1899_c0_g1~~TRINITY_DN1899_c0_g1_i1.p1  ORF type:complete len:429 (-),score=109.55 TRINITY_DN1899_c0_g1_i1:9-1259(-)
MRENFYCQSRLISVLTRRMIFVAVICFLGTTAALMHSNSTKTGTTTALRSHNPPKQPHNVIQQESAESSVSSDRLRAGFVAKQMGASPNGAHPAADFVESETESAADAPSDPTDPTAETSESPANSRKIIFSASVNLQSDDVESTNDNLLKLVEELKGFVISSNVVRASQMEINEANAKFFNSGPFGNRRKARLDIKTGKTIKLDDESDSWKFQQRWQNVHFQIKIPSQSFHHFLAKIPDLGTDVISQSIFGKDVTAQFVDNDTRLKALRSAHERTNLLMQKANSIKDIMLIQNELNQLTMRIEQLEGSQASIVAQTDYATVSINVVQTPDVFVHIDDHPGPQTLWEQCGEIASQTLEVLTAMLNRFIIIAAHFFLFWAPLILVSLLILTIFTFCAWKLMKPIVDKFKSQATTMNK